MSDDCRQVSPLKYIGRTCPLITSFFSVLVLITSLTVGLHSGGSAIASPVRSYEQQLEQVRLYINKNMFEAARSELERLKLTDRGKDDERVYTALAKVNYKLYFITDALSNLRNARQVTRDPKTKESLSALYEQWLTAFGLVRFEPLDQVTRGTIELIRTRKLINKDRQSALSIVQDQLSSPVNLPISVYLPYGNYSANGVEFKLERNRPTPLVELMLAPVAEPQPEVKKQLNIPWLYVGAGAVALIGASVGAYFLSQDTPEANKQLTITISDGR